MSILQNIYDQVGQKAPKRKYRDDQAIADQHLAFLNIKNKGK